jgi:hypothetical protein
MKSRASSFPAERPARRWYREPWPWLLMAGPFVAIVASLASAWLALKSDDGVVAQDYYQQGLRINQRLKHAAANAERELGATITVGAGGAVRVHMEGGGTGAAPQSLRLTLARPASSTHDRIVILKPGPDGDYVGVLGAQKPGRWVVTLESGAWRLPTTTVAGPQSEIRLGAADRS